MWNKIFQCLWFGIVKPFIRLEPLAYTTNPVIRNQRKIRAQIRLAEIMGGFKRCIMGDSNAALFSRYMVLIKFKKLTISVGVPGSTFTDWLNFFMTDIGKVCLAKLMKANPVTVVNLGGNHVLLHKMDTAEQSIKDFHSLFPRAWYTTVVPIHASIFGVLDSASGPGYYAKGAIQINELIQAYCKPFVIDLYTELMNSATQEAWLGILTDPAHLRRWIVYLIRRQFGGAF